MRKAKQLVKKKTTTHTHTRTATPLYLSRCHPIPLNLKTKSPHMHSVRLRLPHPPRCHNRRLLRVCLPHQKQKSPTNTHALRQTQTAASTPVPQQTTSSRVSATSKTKITHKHTCTPSDPDCRIHPGATTDDFFACVCHIKNKNHPTNTHALCQTQTAAFTPVPPQATSSRVSATSKTKITPQTHLHAPLGHRNDPGEPTTPRTSLACLCAAGI